MNILNLFIFPLFQNIVYNVSGKASNYQILFQTPGSLNMEDLVYLHHYIMMYLIMIFIFVFLITYFCYSNYIINNKYLINKFFIVKYLLNKKRKSSYETIYIKHNSLLEFIWTIIPSIILLFISVPSFLLLYSVEETINPDLIIKVIAHQWYWVYEVTKN